MIAQFHVLSPRGDCIITREFSADAPQRAADVFFRKMKFWDSGAPPTFSVDKVNYAFVEKSRMYFVIVSTQPIESFWAIELLSKLIKTFKDFCGVLSEESMRRNFVLIYELIDEIIDNGYPQTTASEVLRIAVHSDAVAVNSPSHGINLSSVTNIPNALSMIPQLRGITAMSGSSTTTIPSSANQRPINAPTSQPAIAGLSLPGNIKIPASLMGVSDELATLKNEIFVDIVERVSAVFSCQNGRYEIQKTSIDGSIQMKSYLSGNPPLQLALNDDLIISTEDQKRSFSSSSSLVLDDAIFHEYADMSEFESSRVLSVPRPPDGEFVLMNYRIGNFGEKIPFRVFPSFHVAGDRVDVSIAIRADLPSQNYGSNLVVTMPLICPVRGVAFSPDNNGEYFAQDEKILWTIKKLCGGQEIVCRAKIHLESSNFASGPISIGFEIPMYSISNLQVKYLRIANDSHKNSDGGPYRWVRYVVQSQSYICRH